MKGEKAKNRNTKADRKTENQTPGQFASAHHVRRFETYERVCEGIAAACALLLTGMGAFGSHRIIVIWATIIGVCAVVLAICFWLSDRKSLRVKVSDRNDGQITSIDALREEGRKLQRIFAAPTGNLPDDEPDRWLEKVQLCLRSIARSYGEHFDEILKDPRRDAGALSPEFNQADMMHWTNDDPRRQHEWPRITAVLNYLARVRYELYKNLK